MSRSFLFYLFLLTALCSSTVFAANASEGKTVETANKDKKKKIFQCFAGEVTKYCTERPKTRKKRPVKVQLSIHLLDILEVNQLERTWTVRAFIYARWKDRRLRFKPVDYGNLSRLSYSGPRAEAQLLRMWTPNLTVINHINRRNSEKNEVAIRRNGTVEYKEVFTVKIRTKFNYQKFPFDQHIATMEIEPFTEIARFVRLVPGVRKSGNSSTLPDTWSVGEFKVKFTTRPGARYELSSDKPGAWLAPDGANDFSLMTISLGLKRDYINFLTTRILILFLLALMLYVSAIGWNSERRSIDWPWEVFLGIIFFSTDAQSMLPTLPYITLYNVLVIEIFGYALCDLLVWVAGARLRIHEDYEMQLTLKRLRIFVVGPLFMIIWWLTIYGYNGSFN